MKLSYAPVAGIMVALAGSVVIAQAPASPKITGPPRHRHTRHQGRRHQRQPRSLRERKRGPGVVGIGYSRL